MRLIPTDNTRWKMEDLANNVPGDLIDATWLNAVHDEIAGVIQVFGGVAIDPAKAHQMADVLAAKFAGYVTTAAQTAAIDAALAAKLAGYVTSAAQATAMTDALTAFLNGAPFRAKVQTIISGYNTSWIGMMVYAPSVGHASVMGTKMVTIRHNPEGTVTDSFETATLEFLRADGAAFNPLQYWDLALRYPSGHTPVIGDDEVWTPGDQPDSDNQGGTSGYWTTVGYAYVRALQ